MGRLAHIAMVSGVQFVNEKARRPFESAWRLSSTGLLEAFRLIFGLLAQLVEHSTVNRRAIGSSPIQAAICEQIATAVTGRGAVYKYPFPP